MKSLKCGEKADMLENLGCKEKLGDESSAFSFSFMYTELVAEEADNTRNTSGHKQKKNQQSLTLSSQTTRKVVAL